MDVFRDLRMAFRALSRKAGATSLAVLSLALAIGFSTAAFSVLDAYSLRELAVRQPRELTRIYATGREHRAEQLSWIEYQALTGRTRLFAGIVAEDRQGPLIRLPDRDDFPITAGVSDNYFDVLGVRAGQGDVFHAGRGSDETVVITDHYWKLRLGSDPAVIGRSLMAGGAPLRIVGVLPPGFNGPNRGLIVDLFVPHQTLFGALKLSNPEAVRDQDFELIGRLRPGVTAEQGRSEVDAILRQVEQEGRAPAPERHAGLEPFTEQSLGAKLSSNAVLLAVAVLLVLIAAANLANLRLVENQSRRRETSVRLALGAGRATLAREHIIQSLLLSLGGLLGGLGLAAWLIKAAPALFYGGRSYIDYGIRMDLRTFAFSSMALVLVALAGALIPLSEAWKRSVLPSMQLSRTTGRSRWLNALVVAQMALVTGGACSAGLLWRSLENLSAIRPAMDPNRPMLLVRGYWPDRVGPERVSALADQMASVPGVQGVAWARRVMLAGSGGGAATPVELPDRPKISLHYNQVSPTYFAVTGGRIVGGRAFLAADGPEATPVVIVNATFVRQLLNNGPAVGQWVKIGGKDRQIVGVAEDGPTIHLRELAAPYLYFPFAQRPVSEATYFVGSVRDPASLTAALRPFVRTADPAFTGMSVTTFQQHLRGARSGEQLAAEVTGSLALVGLLLAAAGLFGVTLNAVARRTPEFGIRVAVGASPGRLMRQVLREASLRVGIALPLGWAMAYLSRHAMEKLLYGIAADDPLTFVVTSGVVAVVGCIAALHPALRAARIDPMVALRHE